METAEKIYLKNLRSYLGDDFNDEALEEAKETSEWGLFMKAMEDYADQFKNPWMAIDDYKNILKNGDQVDLLCSNGERIIDMRSSMGEYGGAIFETTQEFIVPEVDVTHVMYSPKHPKNKS